MGGKVRVLIEVDVETPIHVWNGNSMIHGVDYVIQDDRVLILNSECVVSEISKSLSKSEALEEPILENIKRLVSKGACIDRKLLLIFNVSKAVCRNVESVLGRFKEMTKLYVGDKLVPAIPGSEVKGLIRTAIIYKIIANNNTLASSLIPVLIQNLNDLDRKLRQNKLKDVKKEVKNLGRNFIEKQLFFIQLQSLGLRKRGAKEFMDILNVLMVSDPVSTLDVSSSIRSLLAIDRGGVIGAELVETVDRGRLKLELVIDVDRIDLILSKLSMNTLAENTLKELRSRPREFLEESLREFSKGCIKIEIDRVKRIRDEWIKRGFVRANALARIVTSLNNYLALLERYLKDLDKGVLRARIGFGTNRRWKTVIHAFSDPSLETKLTSFMSNYVRKTSHSRIKHWNDYSLKLVETENGSLVGPGWIRIMLR